MAAGAAAWLPRAAIVIVSDDGLQHLRLAADYRIVVVDGERGFGNGRLLPAGPLREPIAALGRADAVVVNGAAPTRASAAGRSRTALRIEMRLVPGEALALGGAATPQRSRSFSRRPCMPSPASATRRVSFACCARSALSSIEHAFADHHPLVAADLEFGDDLPVLMTEKDAVKCDGFADARLWYVPVSAELTAEAESQLLAHVAKRLTNYRR